MKNFLKHSVKAVIFAAGFVFMLVVTSQIVVPKDNVPKSGLRHTSANGILSEPDNTIDVLILGDSESYRSIIPMQMWEEHGITSYCCGSPAQRLFESEDFFKKAFRNQTPKLVILETDTIFRKFNYDDMLLFEGGLALPVFEYHNRWKTITSNDLSSKINYTYTDIKKGYQFKVTAKEGSTDNYMNKSKAVAPILDQNRNYVKRLKALCDEKGVQLMLFSTPSTKNWNMKRHNSMTKLAKELGIKYIDCNTKRKDIPIDWKTDSYDKGDHMNHYGAQKVTTYLGNYLVENELAVSHKDDPKYSYWNDQLEEFKKEVEFAMKHPELDAVNEFEAEKE